jgi:hypothetical protein
MKGKKKKKKKKGVCNDRHYKQLKIHCYWIIPCLLCYDVDQIPRRCSRLCKVAICLLLQREAQFGFRSGRSCSDGVFFVRCLCELSTVCDFEYAIGILDFSAAFDKVNRRSVKETADIIGCDMETMNVLMNNTTAIVKVDDCLSKSFPTTSGVVLKTKSWFRVGAPGDVKTSPRRRKKKNEKRVIGLGECK